MELTCFSQMCALPGKALQLRCISSTEVENQVGPRGKSLEIRFRVLAYFIFNQTFSEKIESLLFGG